jgi:hypothetical protein
MTPCPDLLCDGAMEHKCTACGRFFDFKLATTKQPKKIPQRADRVAEYEERKKKRT